MTPAPIVLVHGAWAGGWVWRRVLGPLRDAGHEVHAVTLTGLGDRARLLAPDTSLQDHVDDVVALVRAEELRGAVLVGHSYGGMVITGAADRLLADDPASLQRLIYVDAMLPLPGESWSSTHTPGTIAARTAAAQASGNAMPPPDPADFGVAEGPDRDWMMRRQVPHPFAPYREPLAYDAGRWATLPRHFIDCNDPALPTIAAMRDRVRGMPGFDVVEIATGHCPMVTAPEALVRHIVAMARGLGPA